MVEFNVKDYGAVADWDPLHPGAATKNLGAFQATIAACKARAGGAGITGRVVADGHYFLEGTLNVHASILLEGSGNNENTVGGNRCSPGTWLVFPPGCTGLRFWSTWSEPGVLSSEGTADQSVVRNLTISCSGDPRPSGQLGHGIQIHCPVTVENVCVENFGEHGIFIDTQEYGDPAYGNANGTMLLGCRIGANGGDGIRVKGCDCLCIVIGGVVVGQPRLGRQRHRHPEQHVHWNHWRGELGLQPARRLCNVQLQHERQSAQYQYQRIHQLLLGGCASLPRRTATVSSGQLPH